MKIPEETATLPGVVMIDRTAPTAVGSQQSSGVSIPENQSSYSVQGPKPKVES